MRQPSRVGSLSNLGVAFAGLQLAFGAAGGVLIALVGLGIIASGVYDIGSYRYQRIERT